MKKIIACIISYFGEGEIREKRLEMHWKQLEWIKEIPIFESINILAMEYTEEEIQTFKDFDPRINLIHYDKKMPQGIARNILLKDNVYKSNTDWCLFLDNDSSLYNQHMSGINFFKELCETNMDKLKHVDIIVPIDPVQEPFTAEYMKNKTTIDNNIVLKSNPGLKTSFFVMKNFYKHHSIPMYFDERFIMLEDLELACQCAFLGYGVYKTKNMVLKEYGKGLSTLPYDENGGRKAFNDFWALEIYNKWKASGMTIKDGKAEPIKFIRKFYTSSQKPKKIIITKGNKSTPLGNFF